MHPLWHDRANTHTAGSKRRFDCQLKQPAPKSGLGAESADEVTPPTANWKCFSLVCRANSCCRRRASSSSGRELSRRSVAELSGVPISGRFPVTTATLDLPMSADDSHDASWPQSDEDMYLAVTAAWCHMFLRAERRKHPLGPYVFGEDFTRSVARTQIDARRVAGVCARVACFHTHGNRESWPVELLSRETLDPPAAWWCAIEEPDELGVHHVELDSGTLEFLSVAYFGDRPKQGLQ